MAKYVVKFEDPEHGSIKFEKLREDSVSITYTYGENRGQFEFTCTISDLDQDLNSEIDGISKVISKLFNVMDEFDPKTIECVVSEFSYFIEFLLNYMLRRNLRLNKFFEQFKDFKYFGIRVGGQVIFDETHVISLYNTGRGFDDLCSYLLPYQDE